VTARKTTTRSTKTRRPRLRRLSRLLAVLLSSLYASLAAAQIMAPPAANALPTGGQVVVGSGRIVQAGPAAMVVNQQSNRLGIDWQSFDIGAAASVEFRQPSASSIALNRVLGNSGSQIYGRLSANGQVFLTNPNGVLFARGAKVDVGGLVASTLELSQQDFAAGRYEFKDAGGSGSVVNQGRMRAEAGGYLALFGNRVANDGEMTVDAGNVLLASGRAATVSISGSGLISAVVAPGLAGGQVENRGLIAADGGTVRLDARSAEGIASSLVNNSGVIRANSIVEKNGEIWITGDQVKTSGRIGADGAGALSGGRIAVIGDLNKGGADVGGTISARSDSGAGGHVETSAARVAIGGDTRVDTRSGSGRHGTWLIDPTDFTIAAGSGTQTSSGIGATTLASNLQNGNVALATAAGGNEPGDIHVNAAVAWSADTTLTLTAARDINVNAPITATGNQAGLVLSAGGTHRLNNNAAITLSGSAPALSINGQSYTVINSLAALQAIDGDGTALSGRYALGSDIDASGSAALNGGAGFSPIGSETSYNGTSSTAFTGTFDGLGHAITGLTIDKATSSYVGLFASTLNASVRNVNLSGGTVAGSQYVGGLVGYSDGTTTLSQVRASASVTAVDDSNSGVYAGGLVGRFQGSANGSGITGSSAGGAVHGESPTGSGYVGGAVGMMSHGTLAGVSATGAVSFTYVQPSGRAGYAGGLVAYHSSEGGISDSSASGNVSGASYAGGLVADFSGGGSITGSQASGAVAGSYRAGGLVGEATGAGAISGSSASGNVSGADVAGGLVGYASLTGGLAQVSASGTVTATSIAGGLVGQTGGGAIDHGSATGAVQGGNYAGGLVGYHGTTDAITHGQASGNVRGTGNVGGLAGYAASPISDSQASGSVSATSDSSVSIGGLVGYYSGCYYCTTPYTLSNVQASGAVKADSNSGNVGGLVGFMDSGSIAGATVTGSVTAVDSAQSSPASSGHATGGLVGYFGYYNTTGSISDAHTSGAVTGRYYTGGLIGQFNGGSISDSSASGAVAGTYYTGGLIGYGNTRGSITDVSASGNVSSMLTGSYSPYVGGLFGLLTLNDGTLTGVFASGNVSTTATGGNVGGVAGYLQFDSNSATSVNDAVATGEVSGGNVTGGLFGEVYNGYGYGRVTNSHATGHVIGSGYTGGLIGQYTGFSSGSSTDDITNSYATGNVSGVTYTGGLVGYFSGTRGIVGSYATGNVVDRGSTGSTYVGGLVGIYYGYAPSNSSTPGAIKESYATGAVSLAPGATLNSSTRVYAGGLVGFLDGSQTNGGVVTDVHAGGSVTIDNAAGILYAGGLVGYNDAQAITRAYASGAVAATGGSDRFNGGLVASGTEGGSVTAGYWNATTTGQSASFGSTGGALTAAQAKASSSFVGWDIATAANGGKLWRSYDGFTAPLLTRFLTPLALTLADASKTYDGTTSFGNATLPGVSHPEAVFISATSADVGSYNVGSSGVYSVQNGYDIAATGSATLTITPKTITLAGLVADKVYDSTRNAAFVSAGQPTGLVAGEDLTVNTSGASAAFDTKNVGSGKTVTITGLTLGDGAHGKASNYTLGGATTTQASITPAALTVGGFTATNRAYDGSLTVAVTATPSGSVAGRFAGDDVSVDLSGVGSGTMADKNVGTAKAVTVQGAVLSGADAANYRIAGMDDVKVDITPRALTANGLAASNRSYNAQTEVSVRTGDAALTGAVAGDAVQIVDAYVTGNLADKNAGTGKTVTVAGSTMRLRGTDAANYTVQDGTTTVDIAKANLSYSFDSTNQYNKVYDGSAAAAVTIHANPYGGDSISLSYTPAAYSDKNVAYSGGTPTSKTITLAGVTINGTDKDNYTIAAAITTSGTISPKPLTVNGVVAADRVYDGTRDISVNVGSATVDTSAVVAGDSVGVVTPGNGTVVGQTADKNVGTNKAVTVPGFSLTGADAANYTLGGSGSGVTVDITPKPLTAVYTGVDKVYNGSISAGVSVTSSDIVSGDTIYFGADVNICGACGTFATAGSTPTNYTASRDAGVGKTVVVTSNYLYPYYNSDYQNYTLLNPTGTTTATITPKGITPVFTGTHKVYDGTAAATVTLNQNASGIYSGDTVTVSDNAVFAAGKNVGTGKTIDVGNIVLSGANAGNYTLATTSATTTADITPKAVSLSGLAGVNRAYDGTTNVAVRATGALGVSGLIAGDDAHVVTPGGTPSAGTVADKNVGTAKSVAVTGISLAGTDAANYALDSSSVLVDITPKSVAPTFAATTRVYNGGVSVLVTGSSADIVAGDAVTFTQSAAFTGLDARNAGTNKPIAVSNIALDGTDAANYALQSTTATTTGTITPKPITATYTGGTRVYDGLTNLSAPVFGASSGIVAGDIVTFTQQAVFTGDGSAGTNKAVSVTGIGIGGAQAGNYTLNNATASTTASISKRPIGATGITATDRVYDGTRTVSVNTANASIDTSAIIAGDQVSVVLPPGGISTGQLDSKDAGPNRNVTVTGLSLSGSSSANYTVAGATGLTVNIAPKALTAVYGAADKVYDGNADAAITWSSVDLLAIDVGALGVQASGVFSAGKNVGAGKAVTIGSAYLTGVERNNYVLQNPNGSATASITPKDITASYSGGSKVYDGTTAAPVLSTTAGFIAGDSVSLTQSAAFTGSGAKNVGTAKDVAVSAITLAGSDAANYRLTATTANTHASITPKPIAIEGLTAATAVDRVYDGTTTVAVNVQTSGTIQPNSNDIVGGDSVTINLPTGGITTGTMANKNAGANKAVVVDGLSLTGTDAGNYEITATTGVTVNIAQRSLTAGYAGLNKVYDGSASASVSGTSADILSGDVVLITGGGVFTAGKNVGVGKAISVQTGQLSGADAQNYALQNPTGSTSADITPKSITPVYTGGTKVYDGTAAAPITSGTTGFVVGDDVAVAQNALFGGGASAKNVGDNKAVLVSGITLSGTDAGNYALTATSVNTTGSITPKALRVDGLTDVTAVDRVYNGSTQVDVNVRTTGTVTPNPSDLIAGDVVTVSAPANGLTTGTMLDKNVGNDKAVVVAGLTLGGADGGNYWISATSGVSVDITPKSLTATYTGVNKVYDGTTAATIGSSSADIVSGDQVAINASAVFSGGKNVGTNKAITITGATLGDADAGNYVLANPTGTATASITPKVVSVGYAGGTRVYDGGVNAPVTANASGIIAGDDVTLSQSAVFTGAGAKNVGSNKAVQVSNAALSGGDAGNYTLSIDNPTTTASITPKPITIDGLSDVVADRRAYDGTRTVVVHVAGGSTLSPHDGDIVAGDVVTVTGPNNGQTTGTMADKNVGNDKAVVVTGLVLGGADAANYVITATQGVTVDITPKELTANWSGGSRVYDGTAVATLVGSATGIIAGDVVSIGASGTFTGGKNVGIGKAIEFGNGALGGADGGNYMLTNASGSARGDITPRDLSATFVGGTKVYDGTVAAPVMPGGASGLISGDEVTLTADAVFSGTGAKNVGSNKAVAVSGITLGGADAANYNLVNTTATTTASITPKPITITGLSGITATDREYDGTRNVAIAIAGNGMGTPVTNDVIAGDDVSVTGSLAGQTSGLMADKNAGTNKPVSVTGLSLAGVDAANYEIQSISGVSVNITPKAVQVAGLTAQSRVYDGTRSVGIDSSAGTLSGALQLDDVQVAASGVSGEMADKNVGRNKGVTVGSVALTGADAGNYTAQAGDIRVDITPRALVVSASAADKVFDGTTLATLTFGSNALAGDLLTLGGSGAFADINAGSGKTVTAGSFTLAGADAANYRLANTSATTTAAITPRSLTVATNTVVRYAGDPNPAFGFSTSVDGLVSGDHIARVTHTVPAGADASAPGGSVFQVTPSNAVFDNGNAANYALHYASGLLLVLPKPPQIGDALGTGGQGEVEFRAQISPEQFQTVLQGLGNAAAVNNNVPGEAQPGIARRVRAAPASVTADAADAGRVTLPALLQTPLISVDPQLQRQMTGTR
jgi:trimeric autotransporter adhesin